MRLLILIELFLHDVCAPGNGFAGSTVVHILSLLILVTSHKVIAKRRMIELSWISLIGISCWIQSVEATIGRYSSITLVLICW